VEVVYKVDRLTRSLADFGKISIAQAFNTTASMRRLSLNVLLVRAKLGGRKLGRSQIDRRLEQRTAAQARSVVAILVAHGDHQQSDRIGKTLSDLVRRAAGTPGRRLDDRRPRDVLPPPAAPERRVSNDNSPQSSFATTAFPSTGDKPASGNIGSVMAGVGLLKSHAPACDE
jgi:hypothetical protein